MALAALRINDEPWDIVRLIKRGHFGEEMHEAHTKRLGRCAVDFIRLPVDQEKTEKAGERIERDASEIDQLMRSMQHKNIMRFYGVRRKEADNATVEVLMELVTDKTLGEFTGTKPMPEEPARHLLKQICDALVYLHTGLGSCIVHRQINANTIVVSPDGRTPKLIDFSIAVMLMNEKEHYLSLMRGDMHYMAPELFLSPETEETLYSCKSDIWAFGCVLYRLVTGDRPHSDVKSMLQMGRRIQNQGRSPLPTECSSEMRDFYAQCTRRKRDARLSAKDLMQHPFLATGPPSCDPATSDERQEVLSEAASTDEQPTPRVMDSYRVAPNRGVCLVIDVQKYDDKEKFPDRSGSGEDAKAIKDAFEPLKFQVIIPDVTNGTDIWGSLQSAGASSVAGQYDSLVCFIMAYGSYGKVYSNDGEEFELREITDSLKASRCPALKGKPKILFVQTPNHQLSRQQSLVEEGSNDNFSFSVREDDFLVCWSTAKPQQGASFVQLLCQAIKESSNSREDFETLINSTLEKLGSPSLKRGSRLFTNNSASEAVSTLTKKFVLHSEIGKSVLPDKCSDEELLDLCSRPENFDKTYRPLKQTLLMIASAKGKADLVSGMLTRNPQSRVISQQDSQLRTAISLAAFRGHTCVLEAFERAFTGRTDELKTEVNRANSLNQTPLMLAAKSNQTAVLKKLVEMGADLNLQDATKLTAVAHATKEGHLEAVSTLCELKADLKLSDFFKNTPLIWAARCGHESIIAVFKNHLNSEDDLQHWRQKGERDLNAQEWAKLCGHYNCADAIQNAIRSLASPMNAASTPAADNGQEPPPEDGAAGLPDGNPNNPADNHPEGAAGGGSGGTGGAQSIQPIGLYHMSAVKRGLALIIHNWKFPDQGDHLPLAEAAIAAIKAGFERLGLEVSLFENVDSDFLMGIIEASGENFDRIDSFLLCLISHGEQGYVLASDGTRILLENVFRQFRQYSGLRRKPKIFIVQACRALDSDKFVGRSAGQLNSGEHEDCMYVYSTFKKNIRFRRDRDCTRSYFTTSMSDIILYNFDQMTEDLMTCFLKVVDEVTRRTDDRQIPCQLLTLRRRLEFPPVGVRIASMHSEATG